MRYLIEDLYSYEPNCQAAQKVARRKRNLARQLEKKMYSLLTEFYEVKHAVGKFALSTQHSN